METERPKLVNIHGYRIWYGKDELESQEFEKEILKGKTLKQVNKYRYELRKFWTEYFIEEGKDFESIEKKLKVDLSTSVNTSKHDMVIELFNSLKDNSTPNIATIMEMDRSTVDKITKDYLVKLTKTKKK